MWRNIGLGLVAALFLAVNTPANAGRIGGRSATAERVNAHGVDSYTVNFAGGSYAEVAIHGDGDTDLDLYVYDENGNLIAEDTDASDRCLVRWVPRWTGRYTIRVVNRGSLPNVYGIATN